MKLNLGCGLNKKDGWLNVDQSSECEPDLVCNLESFPWPWEDNSVEEIRLIHVLEHLGQDTSTFFGIIKEMYRVCQPDAAIEIVVPHPRHNSFIGDPTHVRIITPGVFNLFSRKNNFASKKSGSSNSPLGLYHHVDFEMVKSHLVLAEPWRGMLDRREITEEQMRQALAMYNNVACEIYMKIKAVKPLRSE